MASPTSPASSSSSPGSPVYNPLQTTPIPNANSLFSPSSATARVGSVRKRRWSGSDSSESSPIPAKRARISVSSPQTESTADTEEQPCCSYSLSSVPPQRTADKVTTSAKRRLSSSSSSSEETPRKRTYKRHNVESPSSPNRSPKRESTPSSLLALLTQRPGGNRGAHSSGHANLGEWATRCNTSAYRKQRAKLNALFVKRLQIEVQHAQASLDNDDCVVARAFQCSTATRSLAITTPIVFMKKRGGYRNRLDWHKLKIALSRLETRSHSALGEHAASQAVRWLKHFFRYVNPSPRLHTEISGRSLTHLCAQAITGQNIDLSEQNAGHITENLRDESSLLSGEDLAIAQQNPESLYSECTVSLLRHVNTPSHHRQDFQREHPSAYTHIDFEQQAQAEAGTEEQVETDSD